METPGRGISESLPRALLSLYGTAIGDGIGEMMFGRHEAAANLIANNELPAGPWFHTDDTEMAISVFETLRSCKKIDQDALARGFMQRYERSPDRGYGSGARRQLRHMLEGADWRVAAQGASEGQGSLGNGSAMRVTPVGAWFAEDFDRVVEEARASALITHTHPKGLAGAIAVALATASAWRLKGNLSADATGQFFDDVLARTPDGETRRGILKAQQLQLFKSPEAAARILGNGSGITCLDTVPFVIWASAKYRTSLVDAIAATASVGGDIDTNCAIVGGIVAVAVDWQGLPADWIANIEPLPMAPIL